MSATPDPHPRDAEAAEYVIGTLPLAEREAFERDLAADPGLLAAVRAWEERLVPLADSLPAVEPPAALRDRLLRAVSASGLAADPAADAVPFLAAAAELRRLRRSRAIWQGATAAVTALAAALALYIAVPRPLPEAPGLVAVVNRSGELPALIVRVDPRAGTVQVRELAAEIPAGRSLELWSIVAGGTPRSLGVLAPGPTRAAVPAEDRPRLGGATIAVTVEPSGGSPTGGPTGPIVYSGRLVSETP